MVPTITTTLFGTTFRMVVLPFRPALPRQRFPSPIGWGILRFRLEIFLAQCVHEALPEVQVQALEEAPEEAPEEVLVPPLVRPVEELLLPVVRLHSLPVLLPVLALISVLAGLEWTQAAPSPPHTPLPTL